MIDANFRLKRKSKNINDDPELAPGWAYMVEETRYQTHLENYVHEKEVSNSELFSY